jgi:hypothetical protein
MIALHSIRKSDAKHRARTPSNGLKTRLLDRRRPTRVLNGAVSLGDHRLAGRDFGS